jgi:hypothetical protein
LEEANHAAGAPCPDARAGTVEVVATSASMVASMDLKDSKISPSLLLGICFCHSFCIEKSKKELFLKNSNQNWSASKANTHHYTVLLPN